LTKWWQRLSDSADAILFVDCAIEALINATRNGLGQLVEPVHI